MRHGFAGLLLAVVSVLTTSAVGEVSSQSEGREVTCLVGRPTDRAATISVLAAQEATGYVEYGAAAGRYQSRTAPQPLKAGVPAEFELWGLTPDADCFYRVCIRWKQDKVDAADERLAEQRFHTQRAVGSTFCFCVQGDSHPERPGRMFDAELYQRALLNVAADRPDFDFLMGDDFSIERLIEQKRLSQGAVNDVYARQRAWLATVGRSTPLMLVNGNHEQAARYLLDGTAQNFAVFAGRARTAFFPLPGPDTAGGVYSGNAEPVEHIGLLRDYYAWRWGDALFVVIDPYWHSPVAVDNQAGAKAPRRDDGKQGGKGAGKGAEPDDGGGAGKGKGARDLWQITLGDTQYRWLARTLRESDARFKFVFCHHVSGTGRGGVEVAPYYEWGGQDRRGGGRSATPAEPAPARTRGIDRFFQSRPTWEKPIHDLMRDNGVTIFFQGHDHLYARQELDGVVYQSCPNPADPTFTAFNRDSYRSGDIFANSGHLRITVGGGVDPNCRVEYIRSARPGDEAAQGKNGSVIHSYTVKPRAAKPATPPSGQEKPR